MVTPEITTLQNAAVAGAEEIHKLSSYLQPFQCRRSFSKELPAPATPLARGQNADGSQRPPFHHLRDEFALLLGISGGNLVLKTWERHQLEPQETEPARLRPALLKLFSNAARLAAPRGASQALKTILRGFENAYFTISLVSANPNYLHKHRFSLLALIQTGHGANLLTTVLSPPLAPPRKSSNPSENDQVRLRREFLFEASCRSKSWTEAYRQSRLLCYGSPRPQLPVSIERRLSEVYSKNLDVSTPASKKKQILSDIARLPPEHGGDQPREFALRAASAVAVSCRPGEDEALLCKLFPASDPRWRISLRKLYRHRPMAESWMLHLRKFWQQEPSLRPYCRVLFSLMRFSRRRAEITHATLPPGPSGERLETAQLRARVERVRQEVRFWNTLLPTDERSAEDDIPMGGTVINLRTSLWQHILKVSAELGLEAPRRVRVLASFHEVGLRSGQDGTEIVLGPVLLSTREGEARFLLARALFRYACGLDGLAARGQTLVPPDQLAKRVQAYNEWMCHASEPLAFLGEARMDPREVEVDELQVALEELFWSTGDVLYARCCEVLANRDFCPRGELEADAFAHRYCDIGEATYGVLASGLSDLAVYRECEALGLSSIHGSLKSNPSLVLRIQSLWMSGMEELQKNAVSGLA